MRTAGFDILKNQSIDFFHIGITVESLSETILLFTELLEYKLLSERELSGNYLGNVLGDPQIVGAKIAMLQSKDGPFLELVEYSYNNGECRHPIVSFGVYHLAHFVPDVEIFLESAKEFGMCPIGSTSEKIPSGPFKDKRIVFLHTRPNLLLELIEK